MIIFHLLDVDFEAAVLASSTLVMVLGMVLLMVVQRLVGLYAMLRSEAAAKIVPRCINAAMLGCGSRIYAGTDH
jgi:hypothetical protein